MMKQNKLFNKVSSLLLASAMTVSMFPSLTTHVHAQENTLPDVTQFATKEQLMTEFDTDMTDGVDNSAKIYFGWFQEDWDYNKCWIVGKDSNEKFGSENVVVFQTQAAHGRTQYYYYDIFSGALPKDHIVKDAERWKNSIYPEGVEISEVYMNHYGASDVGGDKMTTSNVSESGRKLITKTTIYSYDAKNDQIYSTADRLYVPYGNPGETYVTVGSNQPDNLSGSLRIDNEYWNSSFWLREPKVDGPDGEKVFYAKVSNDSISDSYVGDSYVLKDRSDLYAFNLNLSTVSFASSARGAQASVDSNGNLKIEDVKGDGAYTLRIDANKHGIDLGSALIAYDKENVILSDIPEKENIYLVVQNSEGAKAIKINAETDYVSAKSMGLENFKNCKVWIELEEQKVIYPDTLIYATLATEQEPPVAEVNGNQYLTLQDAINDCPEDGEIKLLRDISLGNNGGTVTFNKNCTLNLNDNKITLNKSLNFIIDSDKTLTIVTGENGDIIDGVEIPGSYGSISNSGTLAVKGTLSASIFNSSIIEEGIFKGKVVLSRGVIKGGSFDNIYESYISGKIGGGYFKKDSYPLEKGYIYIDSNNSEYPYKVVNEADVYELHITLGGHLKSESKLLEQVVEKNTEIKPITITVDEGCYLLEGYEDKIEGVNGLAVSVNENRNEFTISGLLKGNASIILPDASVKKDGTKLIEDSFSKIDLKPVEYEKDMKLSDIDLPESSGWLWKDKETPVKFGKQECEAYFDTSNYEITHDFSKVDGYDKYNKNEKRVYRMISVETFIKSSIINKNPNIEAADITLKVGDSFSEEVALEKVKVSDEEDDANGQKVDLTVDITSVNTSKAGEYDITYIATDSQGASTRKTIKVYVVKNDKPDTPNVTGGIGAINNTTEDMEYAEKTTNVDSSSIEWKDCLDGSTPANAGTYLVRFKETETHKASKAKKVEVVASTYTISVDKEKLDFKTKNKGYNVVETQKVSITNEGNSKVTLTLPESSNFDLKLDKTGLAASEAATLSVSPKEGLEADTYNETIEVTTQAGTKASFNVTFKVNPELIVALEPDKVSVIDGEKVVLTASATGGSGNYTYTWYENEEELSTKDSVIEVTPQKGTKYSVRVSDGIETKDKIIDIQVIDKNYNWEIVSLIDFGKIHTGYEDIDSKSLVIKNTGNVDITNINGALAGEDAKYFDLDTSNMIQTIKPDGVTSLSLKPEKEIPVGKYETKLEIKADNGLERTVNIIVEIEDHNYTSVVTPPTCTMPGFTTHTCTSCGYTYTDSDTPVAAHQFGEWHNIKDSTCQDKGSKQRECINCGYKETQDIDLAAHVWDVEYTIDVPATCTKDGSKSIHCQNCDAIDKSESIPALGHAWTEWQIVTPARCETDGSQKRTCTRCTDGEQTEIIKATGHSWDTDYTVDVESTCTEEGKKSVHCSKCDEKSDIQSVEALGHEYGEWKTEIQPGCETEGLQQSICNRCGNVDKVVLPALGHKWDEEYTIDKQPTCTKEGSKSIHCQNCDEIKDAETIKPLGHDFGKWEITKEATTTSKGEKIRKCTRCDKAETEEIAILSGGNSNQNNGSNSQNNNPDKDIESDKDGANTSTKTNTTLWISILSVSLLAFIGIVLLRRKRQH